MPSHQIRVQQNNCEHDWKPVYTLSWGCIKCGKIIRSPATSVKIDNISEP